VENIDVLLVEDDHELSAHLAVEIQAAEFIASVKIAQTLAEAQHYLATEEQNPHMVLCDLGMPDGNGLTLVENAVSKNIPVSDQRY